MPVVMGRARPAGWISAKTVGSFVPGLTKKAFEKYGFSAAALIMDWERIAGSRLAAATSPMRLKWPRLGDESVAAGDARPGATLLLKVDPALALEIEYAARQLIDRINTYFGYRAVAEIRLLQAPQLAKVASPGHAATRASPASAPAGPGLAAALARLEAGIRGQSGSRAGGSGR
jgi:hypothetical protein